MATLGQTVGAAAVAPIRWVAAVLDRPLRLWQSLTGQPGMIVFFLLPNLAIFGVFILVPMVLNFAYSFTGGTELFLPDRTWVGGAQYAQLLDCGNYLDPNTCREDMFWTAVWNTARFVVLQVTLMTGAAMVTALILNSAIRGRGFWRAMFFFPVLLSPVVVGLIWRWILQREGLLNVMVVWLGGERVNWLVERFWAFSATVGVTVWAHMGFYALILLAGLQAIPKDLYEAAEMDGTKPARVFWRITLPLLMPNLLVVVVLALIRAVQIFDEVFVLTGGGPGTATLYLTQYIYEVGFASLLRNPGLAAAASILMGLILVVLTLFQLGVARRNERRGARE